MQRVITRVRARIDAVAQRGQAWVDRQEPGSRSGVAIGAWRAYRDVEGPLQSALLSLYVLVAVLPALLVLEAYLDAHPDSLVRKLVHEFHLNAADGVVAARRARRGSKARAGRGVVRDCERTLLRARVRPRAATDARAHLGTHPREERRRPGALRGGAARAVRADLPAPPPGGRMAEDPRGSV